MVTPTLNLPQPAPWSSAASKTAGIAPPSAAVVSSAAPAKAPEAPSATVTLSPEAMSALASSSHPSSSSASPAASPPAAAPVPSAHDGSVYESLKNGLSTAVTDVGDAISNGAHAVVEGVETGLSNANKVATGLLELPFAVVAKTCDAAGALIDKL